MTQTKMKAIVATGYGTPEVLQFEEVERPQPKDNEVLVKVFATAATTADTMMRSGKPYIARLFLGFKVPKHRIPGTGFAGIIETVGKNVSNFTAGEKVFGETTFGFSTNAEYVTVPSDGVILNIPENLSYAEATTFCDGHLTSINFLKQIAQVKPGQSVLINGASGSLGTAAVQLAKYFGAEVTGVCSSKNIGLVKSLGANFVIDYTQHDFTKSPENYDVIYDTVGKSSFQKCKHILAPNGQYVSPVLDFSLLGQMLFTSLFGKKKAKFEATGTKSIPELRKLLSEVVEIFKTGKLKTIIDRQFPLEKVQQAHQYIDKGHKKGNVVITVNL